MNPFIETSAIVLRRTWGQRLLLALNVLLIAATLSIAALLGYASNRAASINRVALDRSLTELSSDGEGPRVVNVLLVGSDSSANLDPDDPIQIGRQGERLGDVIIVAHLDERDGTVSLLSFPRDLWVPIAGTGRSDRINRSFVVGGPATLIDTIEENFDIPIHHYVNVDFAGFQGLVSAVGSVDVYFETPARDWNVNAQPQPRSQTGFVVTGAGCHALDPEQALAYVRSRFYQTQDTDGTWVTDPRSDLGRIARQQDFLRRLLQEAIDQGARNPLVLADLIDTAVQNVAIDSELTPSVLIDMSSTFRNFEPGDLQSYTFPTADATIGSNRVLVPLDDEAEPLLALFAGSGADDPATVGVEIVYDPDIDDSPAGPARVPGSVDDLVEALADHDFVLGDVDQAETGPGLVVRHGPGGRRAAEVLAVAVRSETGDRPIGFEEVAHLGGRGVVLAVGAGGLGNGRAKMVGPTLVDEDAAAVAAGALGADAAADSGPLGPSVGEIDGAATTRNPAEQGKLCD
ncbi:MAG: LCP family protein [Acidimicrobiales bacterium]